MNWFLKSLIGMLFTAGAIIALKALTSRGVPTEFMTASYFILMAAITAAFIFSRKINIPVAKKIAPLIIILGILGAAANFILFEAVRMAPNPGYAMAIFHTEIVLVAVASVFLFKSELNWKSLLGVLLVAAGVILLVI
jgi:drug/metabolite transporter (DMT)-like permease